MGAGISRGAFHQNVIGRSQDKFARLPTSRVLRATPTKIQHPRETFRLQKLYPLQICFFFALSAPRAFGKPNSVFKNISASIVLVRERTFYCWPYNVLKVTRFRHASAFRELFRSSTLSNDFIGNYYSCLITVLFSFYGVLWGLVLTKSL